jgi:aconitate hydratase
MSTEREYRMFHKEYAAVFDGDAAWQAIQIPQSQTYAWQENSTYIRHPPFFEEINQPPKPLPILNRHVFWRYWRLGHHRSYFSSRNIKKDSPAGRYLQQQGLNRKTSTPMVLDVVIMK